MTRRTKRTNRKGDPPVQLLGDADLEDAFEQIADEVEREARSLTIQEIDRQSAKLGIAPAKIVSIIQTKLEERGVKTVRTKTGIKIL